MKKFMMVVALVMFVLVSAVGLRNLTTKSAQASMSAPAVVLADTGNPMPRNSSGVLVADTGNPMPRPAKQTTN